MYMCLVYKMYSDLKNEKNSNNLKFVLFLWKTWILLERVYMWNVQEKRFNIYIMIMQLKSHCDGISLRSVQPFVYLVGRAQWTHQRVWRLYMCTIENINKRKSTTASKRPSLSLLQCHAYLAFDWKNPDSHSDSESHDEVYYIWQVLKILEPFVFSTQLWFYFSKPRKTLKSSTILLPTTF